MSPEENQLAWPKPEIGSADSRATPGGVAAGKKRSPQADPELDTARTSARAEAEVGRVEDRRVQRQTEELLTSRPETRRSPKTDELVGRGAPWTTRVVHCDSEFAQLRHAWSALLTECAESNVFLSHEWLYSWWSAYRPHAELAIVLAEDHGRLRGIAPMMIETRRRARMTLRTLRFIGDGTTETDHINFVTCASQRSDTVRVLLDAIHRLKWDVAEFNQIPEEAPNSRDLLEWVARMGLGRSVTVTPCPVRRLPASYEELLSSLPSRLRTSIRSTRKKLEQRHTVEFGLHGTPEELRAALETLFANHASRWQGKGQSGAFTDENRRQFYAGLTPRLLERGWLRFFYLKLDGRTVAQQYCFAVDGTVMLLQEGFDFAHAQDNVGNVLRACVFEHLINTGAVCYDFLAGSSRHKKNWSDGVVNDLRVRCARRSWRGWLFFSVPLRWERAKEALKPWRDRLSPWRAKARDQ